MKDHSFYKIKMTTSMIAVLLLSMSVMVFAMDKSDDSAMGATSIGSITVSGGNTRTYNGVNYLLDGDIDVSGSGSKLVFRNSTIKLSQDLGTDGVIGGGDDHIYSIDVSNGGTIEFYNSVLTTQTGQLKPYFNIDITCSGTGSKILLSESTIEGPGNLDIQNGAELEMTDSDIVELQDQTNLNYDIDGDGSTADDKDYNDDGVLLSFSSGATGLIVDSQVRDTFSFDTTSRDGLMASNLTVDGSNTNLTVINSFIDVDLESSTSTGSHNTLRISNGAEAHLVGMSINNSASSSSPAIVIDDTSSSAIYYRWIAANVMDGMNIQVEDQGVKIFRVEGSTNTELDGSYLTSEMLNYMGRTSQTWNFTDDDGWAFIPVITDLFTYNSMPNSIVAPDFDVNVIMGDETLQASTSFVSYPQLPGQDEEVNIVEKVMEDEDFSSRIASDLGGTLSFSKIVVDPSLSSFFGDIDLDMTVNNNVYLSGTAALINGILVPSYYAFDGHLVVSSGGKLTINDTTVNFLTSDGPAYILVEDGGEIEFNNVSLGSRGTGDLYLYLLGANDPAFNMNEGSISIKHIVARDTAKMDVEVDSMEGSLNLYGAQVDIRIDSDTLNLQRVYSNYNDLELSGGMIQIGELDWMEVDLVSRNGSFSLPLDIDGSAELYNVSFHGNLSSDRTTWYEAKNSGIIKRYFWADAQVVDSVTNPLPGSNINVYNVVGTNEMLYSTLTAGEEGKATFPLLQEEIRSSGMTYKGNYKLVADFKGYFSSRYTAALQGNDVNAVITIPGGPNVLTSSLMVDGTLISGNNVTILANITNNGQFDAGPFTVDLLINDDVAGSYDVTDLGAGMNMDVPFSWIAIEGEFNFIVDIDPLGILLETNEEDNSFEQMNSIGFGPDYQIEILEKSEDWVYGVEDQVEVRISNIGEEDPSMTSFKINITWDGMYGNGNVVEEHKVEYIGPGDFITLALNWTPMEVGPVTLFAMIDARFDQVPLNSLNIVNTIVKDLPELMVVTGSFDVESPVPVTINTQTNISFLIRNTGEMPTGNFEVSIYDGDVVPANRINVPVPISSLEPDEETMVQIVWFAGSEVGIHNITVVLDSGNTVMEQNEDDNEWTFQVAVDTPPDVTFASELQISPKEVTEGKNTTFWTWVINEGNTMAKNVRVQFSVDSDVNIIAHKNLDLLPGESVNLTFYWDAEGVGEHTLYVIIDPNNKIIEEIEDNNLAFTPFMVLSKPDIYMSENDLRVLPDGEINIGDNVKLYTTIRNSGQTDAQNIFVRFYDGDPDEGGRIISWKITQPSVIIDLLEAGSSVNIEVPWTPTTGGYHELYAVMDLSDLIDESNEENNKRSWTTYVQTLPDLEFANMTFSQGEVSVNSAGVTKELTINVTLINTGDTVADGFTVTFYNGDFVNDPLAIKIGNEMNFPATAILGHEEVDIGMKWLVTYPKGIRTIFAKVHMLQGEEQTITNNLFGENIEIFDIQDVPEVQIDLNTVELSSRFADMSPGIDGVGYFGTNISIWANISNIGGKAASNTTVHFVVINDTEERVVYSTYLEFLENNGTDRVLGYWTLDSLGTSRIRVVLDPENRVREFDEGNNYFETSIDVQEAPDLSVELIRADSQGWNSKKGMFEMTKGSEYTLIYDITNSGNFTYQDVEVSFTGPAESPRHSVTIGPYQTQRITFTVKPETIFSEDVAWKCKINEGKAVYESDDSNNEAMALFSVKEKEEGPNVALIVIILLIILIIIIAAIGAFFYFRLQSGEKAKCSNCSGLVPLDATVCPHCGVEFSDELECECGETIPKGATECPSCGKPVDANLIGDEEKEDEEGDEESDEEEELEPVDEDSESQDEDTIESLEEPFEDDMAKEGSSEEEELAECFECGALIPVSAPICPHCGAVFE